MTERTIELYLTNSQYKKMDAGQPFQVTYQQLNGNRPADHHVEIHLEKKDFTKLQRNMRNKKGFRFSSKNVLGSGLLSSALSIGKQALQNKTVQSYGKQALQKGLKMASNSNNVLISSAANLASKQLGSGLFDTALSLGKKALNNKTVQSYGKQALQKGLKMAGNSNNALISGAANLASKQLGSGIFDTALSLGKKALQNKAVQSIGKQALQKGLKMAGNSNNALIAGAANFASKQVGGRLKKGSEEAREHMARIRAMRSGCGLFDTALSLGKKALQNKAVQSIGKQALQKGLKMAGNSNNALIAGAANFASKQVGGRLKKGSQEAKDHMARIRAMRKGEGFGSFLKTVGRVAKSPIVGQIAKTALRTAAPIALKIAASNPYTAPAAMLAQGALQSQGISTGGAVSSDVNPYSLIIGGPKQPIKRKRVEILGGSFRELTA